MEELRSDIYRVLRHPHQLKPNLRREEIKAIKQLKADEECIVLTADKGVALVVMDRSDYIKKAKELLDDTNTYRTIQSDPSNKLKNRLINMFRKIKADTGMQENTYRKMYPTGAILLNSMGYQRNIRRTSPDAHSVKHWLCYI